METGPWSIRDVVCNNQSEVAAVLGVSESYISFCKSKYGGMENTITYLLNRKVDKHVYSFCVRGKMFDNLVAAAAAIPQDVYLVQNKAYRDLEKNPECSKQKALQDAIDFFVTRIDAAEIFTMGGIKYACIRGVPGTVYISQKGVAEAIGANPKAFRTYVRDHKSIAEAVEFYTNRGQFEFCLEGVVYTSKRSLAAALGVNKATFIDYLKTHTIEDAVVHYKTEYTKATSPTKATASMAHIDALKEGRAQEFYTVGSHTGLSFSEAAAYAHIKRSSVHSRSAETGEPYQVIFEQAYSDYVLRKKEKEDLISKGINIKQVDRLKSDHNWSTQQAVEYIEECNACAEIVRICGEEYTTSPYHPTIPCITSASIAARFCVPVETLYGYRSRGKSFQEIVDLLMLQNTYTVDGVSYCSVRAVAKAFDINQTRLTVGLSAGKTMQELVDYWRQKDTNFVVGGQIYAKFSDAAKSAGVASSVALIKAKELGDCDAALSFYINNPPTKNGWVINGVVYNSYRELAEYLKVPEPTLKTYMSTHTLEEAVARYANGYRKNNRANPVPVLGYPNAKAACKALSINYQALIARADRCGRSTAEQLLFELHITSMRCQEAADITSLGFAYSGRDGKKYFLCHCERCDKTLLLPEAEVAIFKHSEQFCLEHMV